MSNLGGPGGKEGRAPCPEVRNMQGGDMEEKEDRPQTSWSWEQVLARAIAKEEEARSNYRVLASWVKDPGTRQILTELAEEEGRHKEMLEGWREGQLPSIPPPSGEGPDLLAPGPDFSLDRDLSPEEAVRLAIREEEMAFSFYQALSSSLEGRTRELVERLAGEERRHRMGLKSLLEGRRGREW
jgi:rubrerythrin